MMANFSKRALKRAMVKYAEKEKVKIPKVSTKGGLWGKNARVAAWRVTGHMRKNGRSIIHSAKPTLQLAKALGVPVKNPFKIQKVKLDWAVPLSRRIGQPRMIVWHNSGSDDHNPKDGLQDVLSIHAYHRYTLGWNGFAYTFYVASDGTIFLGRSEWAIGGHAKGAGDCIGVCVEGNFDKQRTMPKAQLEACRELHRYLWRKYKKHDIRHKALPGNLTSCPGSHFPFSDIVSAK